MNRFKLLGLLILSCGVFAARGATGEGILRVQELKDFLAEKEKYYNTLSLEQLEAIASDFATLKEELEEQFPDIKGKNSNFSMILYFKKIILKLIHEKQIAKFFPPGYLERLVSRSDASILQKIWDRKTDEELAHSFLEVQSDGNQATELALVIDRPIAALASRMTKKSTICEVACAPISDGPGATMVEDEASVAVLASDAAVVEALDAYRQISLKELLQLAQGIIDSEKAADARVAVLGDALSEEGPQRKRNRNILQLIILVIQEKLRIKGVTKEQMREGLIVLERAKILFKNEGLCTAVAVGSEAAMVEDEAPVAVLASDGAAVETLVRAVRQDREDLIRELLTEDQIAELVAQHRPQEHQTLIIYSDGSAKIFDNNKLQNLHVLKSLVNNFPGQAIELGIHFRKDPSLNKLFDFIIKLANATPETIDDLRARLSRYSFIDLMTIAQMLDVLMLDNDDFNIEQFLADVLLQKFKEMGAFEKKDTNLGLMPSLVADKRCGEYVLHAMVSRVWQVVFSPDKTTAAIIYLNGKCQFVDIRNVSVKRNIYNVQSVFFSPDKRICAVIANNGECTLYDVETLTPRHSNALKHVDKVFFSPNKKLMVVQKRNYECQLFTVQDLVPVGRTLKDVFKFVFSPDGSMAAVIDVRFKLNLFNIPSLTLHRIIPEEIQDVFFKSDQTELFVRTVRNSWKLYNINIAEENMTFKNVRKMFFSADGTTLAKRYHIADNRCEFFNALTLEPLKDIAHYRTYFSDSNKVVFSPDAQQAIIYLEDRRCIVVNMATLEVEKIFENVKKIFFSADGSMIAAIYFNDVCEFYQKEYSIVECLQIEQDEAVRVVQDLLRTDAMDDLSACTIS